MKIENLAEVADDKTEVFFLLTPEAANTKTLFHEVGWIYAAKLSRTDEWLSGIEYYQYPYVYLGRTTGNKPWWNMVARPWCDFEFLVCFTTLEEAIEFESQQNMSLRRYTGEN